MITHRATTARSLLLTAMFSAPLLAQGNREEFCDEPEEGCTASTLELVFGDEVDGPSGLSAPLAVGTEVRTTVVLDTREGPVFGWSYALQHDPNFLELQPDHCDVSGGEYLCGTDAEAALVSPSFNVSTMVEGGADGPSGFVSAVVLSFIQPTQLVEARRNSLAHIRYTVMRAPEIPTSIRFVDRVLSTGGLATPPVAIVITIRTNSFRPAELVHGVLQHVQLSEDDADLCSDGEDNDADGLTDCDDLDCEAFCVPPVPDFNRGDTDASGRVNVTDAVIILHSLFTGLIPEYDCVDSRDADDDGRLTLTDGVVLLEWLFRQGPVLAAPTGTCGADPTADDLDCAANSENCAG